MANSKPLIVVLGLGEMGMIHAKNLSKVRSIRLGLASSRSEALKTTAASLCADRTFCSYDEAIEDPDVTAVVISTPPPNHPELIIQSASKGKHIFCEKPLGYDSSNIRSATQAVFRAGVRFMSGFNRRWDRDYIAARKSIEDGNLGDPVVLKCTSGDPEYPEKYHRGGAKFAMLKDLAVHDIDLARWLTRSEVKRVFAVCDALTYPSLKERNDADVTVAILEMECGAKVMIHLSRALDFGYCVTTELFCTKGALKIGELKTCTTVTVKDRKSSTGVVWEFAERFEGAFAREMEAFAELVVAGDEEAKEMLTDNSSFADACDGLVATVVAEALVKSSQTGMPELVSYDV